MGKHKPNKMKDLNILLLLINYDCSGNELTYTISIVEIFFFLFSYNTLTFIIEVVIMVWLQVLSIGGFCKSYLRCAVYN